MAVHDFMSNVKRVVIYECHGEINPQKEWISSQIKDESMDYSFPILGAVAM